MKQTFQLLCGAIVCLFLCANMPTLMAQTIVPQPNDIQWYNSYYTVNAFTRVYTNLPKAQSQMFSKYLAKIYGIDLKNTSQRKRTNSIRLIKTTEANEQAQVPFSTQMQGYTLVINDDGVDITSPSEAGLLYGLQTLQGLSVGHLVRHALVNDAPRFAYRGMMLDCSRHFWTVDFIKKQIRMMAQLKLNRLHLHLTDAAGWRMQIDKYPQLTEKTAYRTASNWITWWINNDRRYATKDTPGAYGGYYTKEDLREIVRYAAQHYITVIPEFDVPGHSEEVTYALPQLSCNGKVNGELCIGNEETFEFVENVLKEMIDIFPSAYIHMGGDEASDAHWKECSKCIKRMKDNGLQSTKALQAYMMKRVNTFLNAHGRKLMGWDEMIEGGLPENSAVMAWRGVGEGWKAARLGHKVIMAPIGWYYLDYSQDNPTNQPQSAGGYTSFKMSYDFNIEPDSDEHADLMPFVEGVQGNLWTEYVETGDHVEYMLYPRLLSVAETGWCIAPKNYVKFRQRALVVLDNMRKQGYNVFDLRKEEGTRALSMQTVFHDAVGKEVKFIYPYSEKYQGSGKQTLTDGKFGNWSYRDDRWQGFISSGRVEAIIDMGRQTNITDVSSEFMQFSEPGIYYPGEIELSVSSDGKQFEVLDSRKTTFEDASYFIRPYLWQGNAHGRYVKLCARRSEKGGWVFVDEIVVNKRNNVSLQAK